MITFTEKAAAELSSRVRHGLERRCVRRQRRRPSANGSTRRSATLNQRAHRDDPRVRRRAAARAAGRGGLDPGFEVLDDLPAQLEFETAYDEWLTREMAADPPPAALVDALNLDLDFGLVREAAEKLHGYRDLLPLPAYGGEPADGRAGRSHRCGSGRRARPIEPAPGTGDQAHVSLLEVCRMLDDFEICGRSAGCSLRRAIATASVRY